MITGDKDCRQLITDRVRIYNVRKDQLYDAAALQEDWGVRPDQVVDFQALVGDPVDNVPGVALIGPKAARELLEHYQTLEGIFEHAAEVSGQRKRRTSSRGAEQALLSVGSAFRRGYADRRAVAQHRRAVADCGDSRHPMEMKITLARGCASRAPPRTLFRRDRRAARP